MAFTSVVVFNFFICCRGDGNKNKGVKKLQQKQKEEGVLGYKSGQEQLEQTVQDAEKIGGTI